MTVDNFFTSVSLATKLFLIGLHLVGTLRKNKPHIPQQFLSTKDRAVNSSLFGFNDFLTLVSFIPRKNKSVILLSSKHHDQVVGHNQLPEIIQHYNKNKGKQFCFLSFQLVIF